MRNSRYRTIEKYNLHIIDKEQCDRLGWPRINPTSTIPHDLEAFTLDGDKTKCAHFFADDYRIERLWNKPEKYIPALKKYQCVIAPDYSLYEDMPYPMQIWNLYRSRALAHYWQQNGIDVIPIIRFASGRVMHQAFEGLPRGSVLCASTMGYCRDEQLRQIFKDGIEQAIIRLAPRAILLYGNELEFDHYGTRVVRFENTNIRRIKNGRLGERQ